MNSGADGVERQLDQGPEATVAAVDLGSNSFHMLVARAGSGGLQVLDQLRETVRMAAGLDPNKQLDPEINASALACLERFAERIKGLPGDRVRVVGTNTLRRLRDGGAFVRQAEATLGHPIEIISGVEEARLIYGGVAHGLSPAQERRLVMDIGGGSTELIIGTGFRPRLMESVHMGCVAYSQRFFGDGRISRGAMNRARLAAAVEIEFLLKSYREFGWDVAIGASGTIRSALKVATAAGHQEPEITPRAIEQVIDLCVDTGRVNRLCRIEGLRDDRAASFAGGMAVLAASFNALGIESMRVSERALREGLIYDLLGRLTDRDIRSESVRKLGERFQLDTEQADTVQRTVLRLWARATQGWEVDAPAHRHFVAWAAHLHEIGMAISHSGHHKHGAYVLRNMDLHGFSRDDQQVLAALVRCHRGRLVPATLEALPANWVKPARALVVILRLGVLLNRGRNFNVEDTPAVKVSRKTISLEFAPGWLDEHPLTRGDLEIEAERIRALKFRLRYS